MGGMSIWHWLIVLVIVLLVFGSKKLGNVGSDLGKAIRDFKKGLSEGEDEDKPKDATDEPQLRSGEDPARDSQSRESGTRQRDE